MLIKYSVSILSGLCLVLAAVIPVPSQAAVLNLSNTPLFLVTVEPNVIVMLDNSGSMKQKMYRNAFNPNSEYYGLFDAEKNYTYDDDIPVNTGGYAPLSASKIDAAQKGAFKEDSCQPSAQNLTCWSGNFLNWLTTRRIDASRKVLMGGKLEDSKSAYNYGTDLNWKLVGNNEPSDNNYFTDLSYSNSGSYSPVNNGSAVTMLSPANAGVVLSKYKPYPVLTIPEPAITMDTGSADAFIYNASGDAIGEFGSIEVTPKIIGGSGADKKVLKDSSWGIVTFANTYSSAPVVVAKPSTYDGSDPGLVRIRNVTTTGFEVNMQEWLYKDGNHTSEYIYYTAMKAGGHILASSSGGLAAVAGTLTIDDEMTFNNNCTIDDSDYKTVYFNQYSFMSMDNPIVVTSVLGYNTAPHNKTLAVVSRVGKVTDTYFRVSLQEEEKQGAIDSHGDEDISFIAIDRGTITDTVHEPNWQLEVKLFDNDVKENFVEQTFSISPAFTHIPVFVAAMQTINGVDTTALRMKNLDKTRVKVFTEEEKSCDSEIGHSAEKVGYFAFSKHSSAGGNTIDLNVALALENKPTGLLHDIEGKVRLGVSFYRFNEDKNDIYNGNALNGGTFKFKIPKNPFVKKPSVTDGGYYDLNGHIGMTADEAAETLEHYPLVWGTTPLAENLWEVIRYFEQDTPRYTAGDFDYGRGTAVDPYYFTAHNTKMECAKSSVIIFTDGAPYRDNTAVESHGFPQYNYDGDNNADIDDNEHGDLLDDVAYYAYCGSPGVNGASCANVVTGDGTRDLRSDLDGNQFLKVYTVAFGANRIPSVLQDSADNAGGIAYLAEDGRSLKTALEEAFTAAIDDSSASAVSVNTGSITSDTAVFQARFNSNNWTGELLVFPVDETNGNLGEAKIGAYLPILENDRIIATYNGTRGIPFQWPSTPSSPTADELTIAQQVLLENNENLLLFLRGGHNNEESNGGIFRNRPLIDHDGDNVNDRINIGDMVHSSPAFVGIDANFYYPDNWGANAPENSSPYSDFKATVKALNRGKKCVNSSAVTEGRLAAIYVGSNDGMLHAFNANTLDCDNNGIIDDSNFGKELFAYVPAVLMDKLKNIAAPNYTHQYFVDGSPTVIDAFFDDGNNTGSWHTVLVSGLNHGGQGLFALDITRPSDITTEAELASKILWEFTDDDDSDLGYTFSRPNIVRMSNGVWAAVFGNGYNNTETDGAVSTTGNAVLYIINIQTGALIKKIDTGVGQTDPASGIITGLDHGRPNGLSHIAPVDVDGDSIIDYIYAGDLYGNLWKFDVTDSDTNAWQIYNGANHDKPMFITQGTTTIDGYCDANNNCVDTYKRQPITVRPEVNFHPYYGYLVYFGTGQYIETTDNLAIDQLTQSFYGLWDREIATASIVTSNYLLEQKITNEVAVTVAIDNIDTELNLRITTDNSIIWHTDTASNPSDGNDADNLIDTHLGWFINLYNQENANIDNYGERQVSNPVLRNGRVIFTTLIPSEDPCKSGGDGWIMELEADSGSRPSTAVFDLNGDGYFTIADMVEISEGVYVAPSSPDLIDGIPAAPTILSSGEDAEYKYISTSRGDLEKVNENPGKSEGRQSWKQINF